jgi:acylphosphatase
MTDCRRFIVSGKVQGVFFRAGTQAEARRLDLTGHATNLANGCVEVVACGEARALDKLAAWLDIGPPRARVDKVAMEPIDCAPPGDFIAR